MGISMIFKFIETVNQITVRDKLQKETRDGYPTLNLGWFDNMHYTPILAIGTLSELLILGKTDLNMMTKQCQTSWSQKLSCKKHIKYICNNLPHVT